MPAATLAKLDDLRQDFRDLSRHLLGFRSTILEAKDLRIPVDWTSEPWVLVPYRPVWIRRLIYADEYLAGQFQLPDPPHFREHDRFRQTLVTGAGDRPTRIFTYYRPRGNSIQGPQEADPFRRFFESAASAGRLLAGLPWEPSVIPDGDLGRADPSYITPWSPEGSEGDSSEAYAEIWLLTLHRLGWSMAGGSGLAAKRLFWAWPTYPDGKLSFVTDESGRPVSVDQADEVPPDNQRPPSAATRDESVLPRPAKGWPPHEPKLKFFPYDDEALDHVMGRHDERTPEDQTPKPEAIQYLLQASYQDAVRAFKENKNFFISILQGNPAACSVDAVDLIASSIDEHQPPAALSPPATVAPVVQADDTVAGAPAPVPDETNGTPPSSPGDQRGSGTGGDDLLVTTEEHEKGDPREIPSSLGILKVVFICGKYSDVIYRLKQEGLIESHRWDRMRKQKRLFVIPGPKATEQEVETLQSKSRGNRRSLKRKS